MDVLEDQFILDKRLPRTLGTLFFRPGRLTIEHVNGRIARYIHPFRLYIVTSLVFFLLLSFFSIRFVRDAMERENGPVAVENGPVAVQNGEALDSLVVTDTSPAAPATPGQADTATGADRGPAPPDLPGVPGAAPGERTGPEGGPVPANGPEGPRSVGEMFGWDENPPTVKVGFAAGDSVVMQQVRRLSAMTPREAVETLTGTFFNYVPTLMFLLLPVFASVLKLLYVRRDRFYAEHFVFLLHVHSFVFLLATAMILLQELVAPWLEAVLALWILVYIYLAMWRVYAQGWLKTLVKYWILGWTYFWILIGAAPLAFFAAVLLF